jgi:hypothetical protein
LAGIAATEGKKAIFFSLNGYTAPAIVFANRAAIALFTFNYQGEPVPENKAAKSLLQPR